MKKIYLVIVAFVLIACSKDEDTNKGVDCNKVLREGFMEVDDYPFELISEGYDIIPVDGSYDLNFTYEREIKGPNSYSLDMTIKTPFNQTGTGVAKEVFFKYYDFKGYFTKDLTQTDVIIDVKSNSNNCFLATINGEFIVNERKFIISDGRLGYRHQVELDLE